MVELAGLATVRDMAQVGPISESQWRWLLFHRECNGLARCVVKIGKRVYLDRQAVQEWLDEQRQG